LAAEFGFTCHIRSRGEEAQALEREAGFRARRWVVERTQSWLNRFRRILVRWEKRADTYLAMLHLACGLISWRAANWGARLPLRGVRTDRASNARRGPPSATPNGAFR
jgi:hypothetical protein